MRTLAVTRVLGLLTLLAAVAVTATACSSSTSGTGSGTPAGALSSLLAGASPSVPGGGAGATSADSGASGPTPDPCKVLSTADVQRFMSVPIATALPQPLPGKACTWSANGNGSLGSAITIDILSGQDATDQWSMIKEQSAGDSVMFSGVGDHAEHAHGVLDFVAIKGNILCNLTTLGASQLAGKSQYPAGTLLPDAVATQLAQQYGTLCNKIFGSGSTSPTLSAAPPSGSAIPPSTGPSEPAVSPAPSGGSFAKSFPLPQGVDCSGSHTSTESGTTTCTTTITGDPRAVYAFYLQALPAAGYTIFHQTEGSPDGSVVASIGFSGGAYPEFSDVDINGTMLLISLRASG